MNNADNITWKHGEVFCRWKGMHRDEWVKILGTDGDLIEDRPDLIIIEDTVYCDSSQVLLDYLKEADDDFIDNLNKVKSLGQLRFSAVNMEAVREFQSDLDAYYAIVPEPEEA